MTDQHDELTGIFDHLKADDFKTGIGPNFGREAFTAWVATKIDEIRTAWAASDGHLNAVAMVADSHTHIIITISKGEDLNKYVDRIRVESRKLGATWFFVARRTQVAAYDADVDDETLPNATDSSEALNAVAAQKGVEFTDGVYYYAERQDDDEVDRRHGIMPAQGDRLGTLVEGNADLQEASFFKGIL